MLNCCLFIGIILCSSVHCEARLFCDTKFKNRVRNFVGSSVCSIIFAMSGANAAFFPSSEQKQVNDISSYQKPIAELLDQLRPGRVVNSLGTETTMTLLKGGGEDSNVVTNYLETYIKPCQKTMQLTAPILKLEASEQTKIELLPLLMKGHILELTDAIRAERMDRQTKEVEEVQETLTDFLKLASTKYEVKLYSKPQTLSDAQLYGPMGCEYWGKHRASGSNLCAE